MIKCPSPKCEATMIWGSDFDSEDYGFEQAGIVSTYTCPECESTFDHVQLEEEN